MNRPILTAELATSEALEPVAMTADRIAEIQMACEAVATFATLYRATPAHPSISDYRANRFAQFIEAYQALKDLTND